MELAQAKALPVPLTAAEQDRVRLAAEESGQSVDDFLRAAVLDAVDDPFTAALELAVDTVAARADRVQHDYATSP